MSIKSVTNARAKRAFVFVFIMLLREQGGVRMCRRFLPSLGYFVSYWESSSKCVFFFVPPGIPRVHAVLGELDHVAKAPCRRTCVQYSLAPLCLLPPPRLACCVHVVRMLSACCAHDLAPRFLTDRNKWAMPCLVLELLHRSGEH